MTQITVEVYSDYICPWCYVGFYRLLRIQRILSDEVLIKLTPQPYLLYPTMPITGILKSNLIKRPRPGSSAMLRKELDRERLEILNKNMDIVPNSRPAHEYAERIIDATVRCDFAKEVFHAYFKNSMDISSNQKLSHIIKSTSSLQGLSPESLPVISYGQIDAGFQSAIELGITVVPTLRINERYVLPGLQSTDVWINYIRRAVSRSSHTL